MVESGQVEATTANNAEEKLWLPSLYITSSVPTNLHLGRWRNSKAISKLCWEQVVIKDKAPFEHSFTHSTISTIFLAFWALTCRYEKIQSVNRLSDCWTVFLCVWWLTSIDRQPTKTFSENSHNRNAIWKCISQTIQLLIGSLRQSLKPDDLPRAAVTA